MSSTKGAVFKFSHGRAGASDANVRYITREKAAGDRVWFENVPEHAHQGELRKEQIDNLREYARQREEDELNKNRRGAGKTRTHYRAIYSFDREVSDERAQYMIDEHLSKNFPDARYVAAIHRDTEHTHAHVWIDARTTDERKIQLPNKAYKSLDDDWARTYAREFGERQIYDEHLAKKEQTQEWKRQAYNARQRGEDAPAKPERAADRRNQVSERRAMEAKQYGDQINQEPTARDQRQAQHGESTATRAEQAIDRTKREINALNRAVAETNRNIEQANEQIKRDYEERER